MSANKPTSSPQTSILITPPELLVPWHSTVLRIAGIYNLAWGAFVICFPMAMFRWAGVDPLPNYPELWQCIGMIVGVYGLGYWIAAKDPVRHWPIVLVGFLGKVFGPIGFAQALIQERFPLAFGATIITNDLIWWIPFIAMLMHARQVESVPRREPVVEEPLEDSAAPNAQKKSPRSAIVWSSLQTHSTPMPKAVGGRE